LGYNIHNGGQGFQSELNPNKTDKKYGERNPFYGRVHT